MHEISSSKRKGPWRHRWIRGAVLAIVLVGGAALLLFRLGSATAGRATGADAASRPAEFRAGTRRFDLHPDKLGAPEVAAAVASRVEEESQGVVLAGASEELARVVSERVQLLLSPDFERWLSHVGQYAEVPSPDAGGAYSSEFMELWLQAADGLKGAPIASEGIEVRRIGADDPLPELVPGSLMVRPASSVGAAKYRDPEPGAEAVEVLVPVMFRTADGSRIPGTALIRYYRRPLEVDWRPYDFVLFFGREGMGKELPFPIF